MSSTHPPLHLGSSLASALVRGVQLRAGAEHVGVGLLLLAAGGGEDRHTAAHSVAPLPQYH